MTSRAHTYATENIEAMLLPRVDALCQRLAPDGVRVGHEWQALNPTRPDTKRGSFSINLHTGRWADFADGQAASSREFPCLSLVAYLATGGDFGKAILWAKDYLGLTGRNPDPAKVAAIDAEAAQRRTQRQIEEDAAGERRRKIAHGIWLEGEKLDGRDPASEYLRGRGIDLLALPEIPGCLRYNPRVKIATLTGQAHFAMVAAMSLETAPDGFAAVHATYILPHEEGWKKAFGGDSKKMLGAPSKASIRLTKGPSGKPLSRAPDGEWVALGEGIENVLSFAILRPGLRVLAAATLGNLGKVALPPQIGGVLVIADNDRPGSPGDMTLENACNALVDRGLDIEIYRAPKGFKDFNAALMARNEQERAIPANIAAEMAKPL